MTRRTFLGAACSATVLSGCLGDETDSDEQAKSEGDDSEADDGPGYETHLDDLESYDPVDRTGESEVEIVVAPGGDHRFDPDPVMVEELATVTWNWPESGYEIYPLESPDPCGWVGDDHGTGHSWEFPFVGKYEIGCTTSDGEEFSGVMFVVDAD
ncbi:hypothetical protein AArcMg_0251 [Natrarchaeobaculum sulfurireducens]|uniref:Plastocyanin n=1 Tax=Natrarchaeobaculum sulfurireducens TaxID=2044521 RepID=A0A346PL79_9EURY|nr:Plastocyanin [Natrarchaeobaculum sulfurireducens]AXR80274.1 hypothetical protein AArcMg_0251 [Natrarchaeobaculum sulfurireducens]